MGDERDSTLTTLQNSQLTKSAESFLPKYGETTPFPQEPLLQGTRLLATQRVQPYFLPVCLWCHGGNGSILMGKRKPWSATSQPSSLPSEQLY